MYRTCNQIHRTIQTTTNQRIQIAGKGMSIEFKEGGYIKMTGDASITIKDKDGNETKFLEGDVPYFTGKTTEIHLKIEKTE